MGTAVLCGLAVLGCLHQSVQAQPQEILNDLDRGHRLLLQYGFQLQANAFLGSRATHPYPTDPVNLSVLKAANYNNIHFGSANWDAVMWTSPSAGDYYWSRWSATPTDPNSPSQQGLVMASGQDELNIGDPAVRTQYANYLSQMRTLMPNVISHTTQIGWQPSIDDLRAYMVQGQPDMLYFDDYSFPDTAANAPVGGSPTNWYRTLGRFRAVGREGHDGTGNTPIPTGMWIQTYKRDGYVLSESQLAHQYGAALAYGYKSIAAHTYGTRDPNQELASVFFSGPDGTNPTPLYYRVAELNRQTQNLAPSLLRLKSEKVTFVRGQHKGVFNLNVNNTVPEYASQWQSSDDPYITSISVNNLGSKNDGLDGDVIVSYFKPLHEGFDGPNFSEQLYFMITNGLSDPTANSTETRQSVRLDFNFGSSGINSLQRLDRDTGEVVETALIHDGGSLYHLDWFLQGGEGDLFKFNTGAAFVIPEPATAAMMSLFGLALLRRRRA
jgi:hypothetical protein